MPNTAPFLFILLAALPIHAQQPEFEQLGARALAAVQASRLEDAIPLYRRMLVLDPSNAAVRYDLALALNRLGRARESLAALGTPREADALALAGVNLRLLGQSQSAVTMLQRAFALSPTAPLAYDLGLALVELDQNAAAERIFAKFPDDSRCLVGFGLVAFAAGRNEQAEQAFLKAAALEPSAADIQASLGDVRVASNQFQAAAESYDKALRLEPANPDHYVKAARNHNRLNQEADADRLLRTALRLDPLHGDANSELARMLSAKGDRATARRLLETAIAADPTKSNPHYQLLLLCRALEDQPCVESSRRRFDELKREDTPLRVAMLPPSVIVEGPADEKRWGRYQFPTMHRLADGRLAVSVHVEADSASSYGAAKPIFVSSDEGFSWRSDPSAENQPHGFRLASGDWLKIQTTPALDAASLKLPTSTGAFSSYGAEYKLYPMRDLPRDLRLIFFRRFTAGKWVEENTELNDPDGLRYTVQGFFPRIWWGDLRTAKDGSLLAVTYPSIANQPPFKFGSACWRSLDRGKTWQLRGRIPYQPNTQADPKAEKRDGFTEPAFDVLPDGSLYAVLRTSDGNGLGPMYEVRSRDLGRTWTPPAPITPNGVLPRLLRLENGILVMASGRPGVQLRFSRKGNGSDWSAPWDLLPYDSAKPQADSCGYTSLVALDKDSFLIVYSWFRKPDQQGNPRKTILARRIRVAAR